MTLHPDFRTFSIRCIEFGHINGEPRYMAFAINHLHERHDEEVEAVTSKRHTARTQVKREMISRGYRFENKNTI